MFATTHLATTSPIGWLQALLCLWCPCRKAKSSRTFHVAVFVKLQLTSSLFIRNRFKWVFCRRIMILKDYQKSIRSINLLSLRSRIVLTDGALFGSATHLQCIPEQAPKVEVNLWGKLHFLLSFNKHSLFSALLALAWKTSAPRHSLNVTVPEELATSLRTNSASGSQLSRRDNSLQWAFLIENWKYINVLNECIHNIT